MPHCCVRRPELRRPGSVAWTGEGSPAHAGTMPGAPWCPVPIQRSDGNLHCEWSKLTRLARSPTSLRASARQANSLPSSARLSIVAGSLPLHALCLPQSGLRLPPTWHCRCVRCGNSPHSSNAARCARERCHRTCHNHPDRPPSRLCRPSHIVRGIHPTKDETSRTVRAGASRSRPIRRTRH